MNQEFLNQEDNNNNDADGSNNSENCIICNCNKRVEWR